MTAPRSTEYLVGLVRELCKLPRETEWLELKENNADPRGIGEYLSALANAAALDGKANARLLRRERHAKKLVKYMPRWATAASPHRRSTP